ncbi:MAG: LysR family transcriptional regulator [Actinomycetota bacterium]|nr:LysR family transcriptional regulator [Actinomycetota bacterium]
MPLNPDHLVTFARVAEVGSLSRAAASLNLTQPAVSNQMNGLARAAGEPLFKRHRLGVTLTPAGRELLPHARAVVRALEGAAAAAAGLRAYR